MRFGPTSLLALAILAAALLLPSAAGAVTLGSTHVGQSSNAGIFCGGFPSCAYVQTSLPDGTTRAPFDGRIKAWNVNVSDPGSLQLLVLRKRDNGKLRAVAGSGVKSPATGGVESYGANLKVAKGDRIGLNLLDENVLISVLDATGANVRGFVPAFAVPGGQPADEPYSSGLTELQLNAKLKR
jgi:hypothetical protein